jgi:hypothetical protein
VELGWASVSGTVYLTFLLRLKLSANPPLKYIENVQYLNLHALQTQSTLTAREQDRFALRNQQACSQELQIEHY